MNKCLILVQLFFINLICPAFEIIAQNPIQNIGHIDSIPQQSKPGWFQTGSIDFISSGMINSNAQILTLNIGNPNRFHLPFYFLIGTTIDIFKSNRPINESAILDLINTKGGMVNFGFKGDFNLWTTKDTSQLLMTYQLGAKSINGTVYEVGNQVSFLSKLMTLGLKFKTKAWISNSFNNRGVAWINPYLSCSLNDKKKLFLLTNQSCHSVLFGGNIEGGAIIKEYVHLQFGYYIYLNQQSIALFNKSMLKLAAYFNFR